LSWLRIVNSVIKELVIMMICLIQADCLQCKSCIISESIST